MKVKIRLVQCCRVCKKPIEEGNSGETFTIDSASYEIKHYHGDCDNEYKRNDM